ncbi:MAG TPA: M67 family metallopeptidase [Urbifossiella sp.]|jgi:proteasome lid subunit RPN8/RPN11|nr:M67 family metallopeptidase [Urbifossiella sp.]
MPALRSLLIPADILAAVVAHARAVAPAECCGLLAGTPDGRVSLHFPVRNDLASPTEYLTNPRDMLAASKAVRAAGVDVLAIYHSHPASAALPSAKDVAGNHWGGAVVHLIVGLAGAAPDVQVWHIADGGYAAATWAVLPAAGGI